MSKRREIPTLFVRLSHHDPGSSYRFCHSSSRVTSRSGPADGFSSASRVRTEGGVLRLSIHRASFVSLCLKSGALGLVW